MAGVDRWGDGQPCRLRFHPGEELLRQFLVQQPVTATALIEEAIALPRRHPAGCLTNEQLWADTAEPANSIPRDRRTDSPCLRISVWEQGHHRCCYWISENSPALLDSELHLTIASLLEPHLKR